jgi:hypothetical protein
MIQIVSVIHLQSGYARNIIGYFVSVNIQVLIGGGNSV